MPRGVSPSPEIVAQERETSASLATGSARSFLFTILGELVWPTGGPVRTATLLHILTALGFEEPAARQAIARAAASDWIDPERHGREVTWSLTPKITAIFAAGSARVYSMTATYDDWDGRWLVVLPTIPQELRRTRRPLYAGLAWAGLGDPAPGLWVSPHVDRIEEIGALIDRLGLRAHTVSFVGTVESVGMTAADLVARGWDLAALGEFYAATLERVDREHPSTPEATLLAQMRIMNAWQEFPRTDPQLPEALLPNWIGSAVARRIDGLRHAWSPVTRIRFAELDGR